jgi:hypothetical protein
LLGEDLPNLHLSHSNIHRNTDFDEIHDHIKKNIRLSKRFCDQAYSTRLMQHFYSLEERERLESKWMGRDRL